MIYFGQKSQRLALSSPLLSARIGISLGSALISSPLYVFYDTYDTFHTSLSFNQLPNFLHFRSFDISAGNPEKVFGCADVDLNKFRSPALKPKYP